MTVGQKLYLGFGVVLLLTVIISIIAITSLRDVDQLGESMYLDRVAPLKFLSEAHTQADHVDAALVRTLLDRSEQNRATQAAAIERGIAEVDRQVAAEEATALVADERQALTSFHSNWSQYLEALRVVQRLTASDTVAATQSYFDRVAPLLTKVDQDLDTLIDIQDREAKALNENINSAYTRDRNIIIALAIASIVIGVGVAVWLTRHIAQSLRAAAASAELIAGGDLTKTIEVSSRDEIGQFGRSFNRMVEGLRDLTRAVQSGASGLAEATSQISAAVTQQAAGASEQAAAVSQTTATVDEVRVTSQQATLQAQSVADLASRALHVAAIGRESVDRSVTGMQGLRTRVESIAEQMLALSEHTQQVGEIISTVDDLADQSNLLAVNAAIEAARAGEQGRSFAVVANQVRTLADRSKSATVQVRSILSDIQRAANAAVLATEQGTKDAEEGERLVNEAGDTIQQLADAIEQATGSAQHISATVGQQEAGMDQVAVAMANINQATMETAASSRQLQGAAKNINDLAQQLTALTAKYKVA